LREIRSSLS